jgi:hypothetical protein
MIPSVVPACLSGDGVGALDRLRVDDPRRRLDVLAALLDPDPLAQRVVDAVDGAVLAPPVEVPVHGLPGREVLGQHPPRAARAVDVQDRVDDLALVMLGRAARRPGRRLGQQRLDQLPLPIGQVRRIAALRGHTSLFRK